MIDYIEYVNIKQGTDSKMTFSVGNTLPYVAAPFGMNGFCIQTGGSDERWFYNPNVRSCEGIRLTHQPSPWVGDYGRMIFMPQSGDYCFNEEIRSEYDEIDMKPSFMKIYLRKYQAQVAIAPTDRCSIINVKWDTDGTHRFTLLPINRTMEFVVDAEKSAVSGFVNDYGDGTRKDFKMYFHMKFDSTIDMNKTVLLPNGNEVLNGKIHSGTGMGLSLAFNISKGEELNVRLATSFVSVEFAEMSLENEVGDKEYGDISKETTEKWNSLLSKIQIGDTPEKKRIFYSCLYRCFLFPRIFYEYDGNMNPVHYSTKSGEIKNGFMYTDNGFWDTYRTLYPLFILLIPERVKEMMSGYLNFYKEEGWLPKWVSPGERGIMPGTLIDAVLSDAAVKGILTNGQMEIALEGMIRNSSVQSDTKNNGRIGVKEYNLLGYVPCDMYGESVNNSLDAYFCDYCIAILAEKLGKKEISREYFARSQNYHLLFDEKAGFIRGRRADGSRDDHFSPIEWGGEYCEGGAWQNAFAVYHDIDGMAMLYGGREGLCGKLDELFSMPPVFEVGTYKCEIHEMTEMANADFGQCAISNQPSFHIPYLYSALGCQEKTKYWIKRITAEGFTEEKFPGDEDNGSMSAWYVFSVMGLYPICPSNGEYVKGVCCADKVLVELGNGKRLVLENGETDENIITHDKLMNGGVVYI